MIELSQALRSLFALMEKGGHAPPSRDVLLVELKEGDIDERGRFRVRRGDLLKPSEYEPRWKELMAAGMPWVNVSCYGVDNGALVVGVEFKSGQGNPASRTSVNYSGPSNSALAKGWSVAEVLALE